MSVGVCIINRNGIALAADSAGTYTGNKMFYNSMNKVFSISRKYVYGVITYGATVIHNVSIDQVLKEFRTFLDSKSEVNDFFEILPSFVEFIEQKNKMIIPNYAAPFTVIMGYTHIYCQFRFRISLLRYSVLFSDALIG